MREPRHRREIRAFHQGHCSRPKACARATRWLAILLAVSVPVAFVPMQVSAAAGTTASATGNHPVTEAIIAGDTALVKTLLDEGLDPNKPYNFKHPRWNMGETTTKLPTTTAGMFGRVEILKLLHGHPKFRNSRADNTWTLCMAIAHRNTGAALFALGKGVYVNPRGGCLNYWTPLSRARDMALDEVVEALLRAGAK